MENRGRQIGIQPQRASRDGLRLIKRSFDYLHAL